MARIPITSTRMSAEERREMVLEAAAREFAISGLHGTPGEVIAERAGISQPYLFRLFGTKKELFLAVVELSFDRILNALREAAERSPGADVLDSMRRAYRVALSENHGFLLQMQTYAACGDDEVRFTVRRRFSECFQFIERASGASEEDVREFFADGMLMALGAALRLPDVASREGWARRVLGPER